MEWKHTGPQHRGVLVGPGRQGHGKLLLALDTSAAGVGGADPRPTGADAAAAAGGPSPSRARAGPTSSTTSSSRRCTCLIVIGKKIEAYVGSKTVIQIRSHAQKYFLKVQKNGTGEHLPPPRPKRKAAHPYPHKASKKAPQVVLPQQASHIMEQGCATPIDTSTIATKSSANDVFPSWDSCLGQHFSPRPTQGATNNCSSSIESQSGTWPTSEAIEQEIVLPALRAMPDFARVYNFLGSIFDPETSGHLQRLREMDPIDVETVLSLMKNLLMNLTSPNFEEHGNEQMREECCCRHSRHSEF